MEVRRARASLAVPRPCRARRAAAAPSPNPLFRLTSTAIAARRASRASALGLRSRKTTLRSEAEGAESVAGRFDSQLWPRVDAGEFREGATVRLDAYRLKNASDGQGDWCAATLYNTHLVTPFRDADAPGPPR